jgi:L-lactate dehydrogenase complex protein LldG
MSDSRSRILASIRRSLASAQWPPAPSVTLPPSSLTTDSLITDYSSLIHQFASELESLGGLFVAEPVEMIPARVKQIVCERNAGAVLAWSAEHLSAPGLLDHLRDAGIRIVDADVPRGEPERSRKLAEIESVAVGITGADAALADTGTLALRSGPGRPRLASLSVQTHIAVFTPEQLYASWADWWAALPNCPAWASAASNLTLISGPSRTADIEMTLTVGVHGPREVIALCAQ